MMANGKRSLDEDPLEGLAEGEKEALLRRWRAYREAQSRLLDAAATEEPLFAPEIEEIP